MLSTHLYADGGQADLLCIPGGGSRIPASHEAIDQGLQYVHMKGNETFKLAVKGMAEAANAALAANDVSASDLALLIPHQANIRIIEATAQRLHLPMSKVFVNIQRYGNTSGATDPHRPGRGRAGGACRSRGPGSARRFRGRVHLGVGADPVVRRCAWTRTSGRRTRTDC